MTDHPTIDPWRSLGGVAQKVVLERPDHPTILEQIDAVEWAEAQAIALRHLAALDARQSVGLPGRHRRGLTKQQLNTLRIRLEAAAETLRTLEFGSAIAR